MAIEATSSRYRKTNLKIGIAICIGLAIYCIYDGYYNEEFRKKHTDADGVPDSTLVFNQKSPSYLIGIAVLLGAGLFAVGRKKVVAEESGLIINDKEKIPYDSIEKIDKTYFDSKGFFTITYKDKDGSELNRKLSDKTYDNLAAILDELVAKIS